MARTSRAGGVILSYIALGMASWRTWLGMAGMACHGVTDAIKMNIDISFAWHICTSYNLFIQFLSC